MLRGAVSWLKNNMADMLYRGKYISCENLLFQPGIVLTGSYGV